MDRGEIYLSNHLFESFSNKCLLEKYHVVNEFNDFVKYLIKDVDKYNDQYTYTGWNFSNKNCICLFDETIKYPIYLKVINDYYYSNIMSITDREFSQDKILITINKAKLSSNKIDIQSILFHECRHCLEMYISDTNCIKDKIIDAKNDECLLQLSNANVYRCLSIIDIFSDSEERARIDSAIHYLQLSIKNKKGKKPKYKVKDIESLMDKVNDYALISQMYEYLDVLNAHIRMGIDDYELPLYSGYMFKKYNCGNCGTLNIDIYKKMSDDEKENLSKQFYKIIENNLNEFLTRLYKAIFVHIIEKD